MPTYPNPFLKLTFGGTQAAGQDEWNCGINLSMTNDAALPILPVDARRTFESYSEDIDEDIVSILSNYVSNSDMDIPNAATLDYIKLALIGTDGIYMEDSKLWEVEGVTGGSDRFYIPQVSLVMTLQTNKRSDPGKFGRFYLPTAVPSGLSGYRPVRVQEKAQLTANMIGSLNRSLNPLSGATRVQAAAVSSSPKVNGVYHPFTRVRVGDVYDTQRRRRNRIPEMYSEEAIPVPTIIEDLTPIDP